MNEKDMNEKDYADVIHNLLEIFHSQEVQSLIEKETQRVAAEQETKRILKEQAEVEAHRRYMESITIPEEDRPYIPDELPVLN